MKRSDPSGIPDTAFVNAVRLNARHWLAVLTIVLLVIGLTPWFWTKIERFDVGTDYRVPYALSKDYWLYERRLKRLTPTNIVVLGDSVVWGEYVRPDGTLSHFLNRETGDAGFINAGVNGAFPLALEGLVRGYGGPLKHRKVLLHDNALWMSSPKADLSTEKEERFNHAALVPQFYPRIPCYKADLDTRLGNVFERYIPFLQWVGHLQTDYFDQKSIIDWTLADDGGDPPHFPNAYRNPLSQISLQIPSAPMNDPDRGPQSPRHQPWSSQAEGSARFDWVQLDTSLQWAALCRLIHWLQDRDNNLLVMVGPFNEHMMAASNREDYRKVRDGMLSWLSEHHVPYVAPETLPSLLYADASHPLTKGYERLARELLRDRTFRSWLEAP